MIAFFLSPLGRKLALAIAVLALLAGAYFYVYNKGHEAGRLAGVRAQLDEDRAEFEKVQAAFTHAMAEYRQQDDAAKQLIAQKDSELAALKQQRNVAREAVNRLSDAEVANAISGADQRELLRIAADYPLVVKQNGELEGKIAALEQRVSAIEGQRDAAVNAYDRLVPLYTRAYNAAQTKHSLWLKVITFGLVRDKHLDLPTPVSLKP